MKLFIAGVSLSSIILLSTTAFAEEKVWNCRVDDVIKDQTVAVSIHAPTLDYYLKYAATNGQIIERHDRLITTTTVSTYKIKRESCSESKGLSADGTVFTYQFTCGKWVRGDLKFDMRSREGSFFQESATGLRRSFKFSSCKIKS